MNLDLGMPPAVQDDHYAPKFTKSSWSQPDPQNTHLWRLGRNLRPLPDKTLLSAFLLHPTLPALPVLAKGQL